MIRKLFLGSAVALVAAVALLLTVGHSEGPKPAEAVVASISTTTSTINNAFWAQLHIIAEDDLFGNPNTSEYDVRVTATAGDFGGLDDCALVFPQWAQTGCAPVLLPIPLPACYYDNGIPPTPACVILQTNGFPILDGFPTLLGPADRDVWICNTGESVGYFVDCSGLGRDGQDPIDLSPYPQANTTEIEIWWQSPNGFPGGTVTFTAWQGSSVKSTAIVVRGAPATIDLKAQRDYTSESSSCQDTPVYVIAAVEYSFNNPTTFNNNRAIICADVRDSNNTPLPDTEVIWTVTGGGCLDDAVTNTETNGLTHNRLESCSTGNSGDVAHVTAQSGSAIDSVDVEFGGDPASCTMVVTPESLDLGDTGDATATFIDELGNKVPDGIVVNFTAVSSGDSSGNVSLISNVDDTTNSEAGVKFIAAIAGDVVIGANIETTGLTGDASCAETTTLSGDIHITPGVCDDTDFILYGNKPPAGGGFGTFAFCGGSYDQLLTASGCPKATAVFFYNTPAGGFVVWIPGTDVTSVNDAIFAIFPNEHTPIPTGTIFTAKCK